MPRKKTKLLKIAALACLLGRTRCTEKEGTPTEELPKIRSLRLPRGAIPRPVASQNSLKGASQELLAKNQAPSRTDKTGTMVRLSRHKILIFHITRLILTAVFFQKMLL